METIIGESRLQQLQGSTWHLGMLTSRHCSFIAVFVLCSFGGLSTPVLAQNDVPSRFLDTWNQSDRLLGQPDRLATLWRGFAEQHTEHELGQVARLNQALWTLRQIMEERNHTAGDVDEDTLAPVLALLELPRPTAEAPHASPMYDYVYRAALGLRARVRMIELAASLQAYYAKHVEYPATLETLVEANLASAERIIDPFGSHYEYSAEPRAIMPDIARQKFSLRCTSIDAEHEELEGLLERLGEPVADLQISSLVPDRGQAYVRDRQRDGAWGTTRRWDVGQQPRERQLWAVYEDYLLMSRNQVPQVMRLEETQE